MVQRSGLMFDLETKTWLKNIRSTSSGFNRIG
jgi:hypothetical protein